MPAGEYLPSICCVRNIYPSVLQIQSSGEAFCVWNEETKLQCITHLMLQCFVHCSKQIIFSPGLNTCKARELIFGQLSLLEGSFL